MALENVKEGYFDRCGSERIIRCGDKVAIKFKTKHCAQMWTYLMLVGAQLKNFTSIDVRLGSRQVFCHGSWHVVRRQYPRAARTATRSGLRNPVVRNRRHPCWNGWCRRRLCDPCIWERDDATRDRARMLALIEPSARDKIRLPSFSTKPTPADATPWLLVRYLHLRSWSSLVDSPLKVGDGTTSVEFC